MVGLVLFLPALLLAPVTGLVADRVDRRRIIIVAAGAEIGACAAFTLLAGTHGPLALIGNLLVIAVLGISRAFAWPAESSLLVTVVAPERFLSAQATASALQQFVVIAGPALGGFLIAATPLAAFGTAAVLFAVAGCALGGVRLRVAPPAPEHPPTLRDAFAGLRFVRERPIVAGAITLDLVAVFFGGATALLPVYAATIFHVGAGGFGVLRSSVAVGAALSAVWLARRPLRTAVGRTFLVAVATFGVATIAFGLAQQMWVALLALALVGASDMVSVVVRSSLINLGTPDAMRGRVTAVEGVAIVASNELGEFESGALATLIGPVATVIAGGVVVVLAVGWWALTNSALRRVDVIDTAA